MSKIGEFRGIAAERNRKLLEHNRHRPSQQKWDQNEIKQSTYTLRASKEWWLMPNAWDLYPKCRSVVSWARLSPCENHGRSTVSFLDTEGVWLHFNHQKSESRCLILVSSTSISKLNITTPFLVSYSVAVLKLDWSSSLLVLVEFIPHHTSVPQCGCPKLDWLSSLLVLMELIPHHTVSYSVTVLKLSSLP